MDTLYNKCSIRIGIDTIRIKLERIYDDNDPIPRLVEKLNNGLGQDDVSIFQCDGHHFLKDNHSKRYISKIYKTGKNKCVFEIFGMLQTHNLFKLCDYHTTILSIVGNLKGTYKTLEKMDIACDFFYPHERSFVFDGLSRHDMVDFINYQIKFPFVHLTEIPMTTIRVPKKQKPIIRFTLNHRQIKSTDKKKHGDCYYRWVKPTSVFLQRINYGQCEKKESTHFEIKINKRKFLYTIARYFDGSETFDSEYDHETQTHMSRQSKKVSHISYDKSGRDEEKHGPMMDIYMDIVKEIAESDDEHNDLMDFVDNFPHTRFESRFLQPGVTTKQKPLELNKGSNFELLLPYFKKHIEKHTIFILKPGVSTDDYLNIYKERLKKVNAVKPITSSDFGKVIGLNLDNWNNLDNQINTLKSFFIK